MNVSTHALGGLSCRIVDQLPSGTEPRLIVVLCHGFGAPGTDLVPLAPELLTLNSELQNHVRFVFPAAPLALDEMAMYGGRAWWHIDVNRLTASIERREFGDLRADVPDGLPEARGMLQSLLEDLKQQTGLKAENLVLGGFSQGSMLATDVSLRLDEPPAGLCIFSGTLLCEDEWRKLAKKRGPLPVLQSHGYEDPILPYQAAEWLRDMLLESGFEVEFIPFHGFHTISQQAVERCAALLGRLISA